METLIEISEGGVRSNKRFLIFWYAWLGFVMGLSVWSFTNGWWILVFLNAANIGFIIWQIRVTYRRRDEWKTKADSYKRGIYPTY